LTFVSDLDWVFVSGVVFCLLGWDARAALLGYLPWWVLLDGLAFDDLGVGNELW
jgi:hypothetical protein